MFSLMLELWRRFRGAMRAPCRTLHPMTTPRPGKIPHVGFPSIPFVIWHNFPWHVFLHQRLSYFLSHNIFQFSIWELDRSVKVVVAALSIYRSECSVAFTHTTTKYCLLSIVNDHFLPTSRTLCSYSPTPDFQMYFTRIVLVSKWRTKFKKPQCLVHWVSSHVLRHLITSLPVCASRYWAMFSIVRLCFSSVPIHTKAWWTFIRKIV